MDAKLRTRLAKVAIWLMAEITLNFLGMDTIAAYGEFVLGQSEIVGFNQSIVMLQV